MRTYHISDDTLWVVPQLEIEQFNEVENSSNV